MNIGGTNEWRGAKRVQEVQTSAGGADECRRAQMNKGGINKCRRVWMSAEGHRQKQKGADENRRV